MGDLVSNIIRWTMTLPFILATIFAFIVLLNFIISLVGITINQSVLGDLFALIQMWLPFNLNSILWWFTTATVIYITYRISIFALTWMQRFIGNN